MPKKTTKNQELLTRTIDLTRESIVDENSRLVRLSFSSEEPVTRQSFFSEPWIEVLGHDKDEADLERLNSSAPLLYNHDRSERDNRIGVVERAWIEKGRGHAEVRLSKRAEVEGIWQDVRDGILRNVSVAYRINERKLEQENKDTPDLYRVTSWTPMEISLVDIPADSTVGVGRSEETQPQPNQEETIMPKKLNEMPERNEEVDIDSLRKTAADEGATRALELEKARRTEIRTLFTNHDDHTEVRDACLDDPEIDINEARKLLLDAIGKNEQPAASGQRIEMGESAAEKFSRAAEDAISVRAGLLDDRSKASELCGYQLVDIARKCLELHNVRTEGMDRSTMIGRAFTHSSSDFPKILENNARKAMLRGYEEAPEIFPRFTRAGNLSDFKIHTRTGIGTVASLRKVEEGGEYKHTTIGERGEQIQLATYGELFSITRHAIINDDLEAFTRIPRTLGRAAARTVGDLVFSILTDNPNMSDGKAVFHADHKNLAASGTAISAASVSKARAAMRKQKDGDATLNIRPSFMLTPVDIVDTAAVLMSSETNPDQANSRVRNLATVNGALEVLADARLDAASATAWYLLADANSFDTIEVGYLDGVALPFLDDMDGWTIDGREYKVRIDAAASPLEYRTMYKNPGA
ncbi:Mu-like prophage major head subunit gpT family protein [Rickettsiales bacterium]|nr:Mu-like prophage major head subunit gpT family protein [Rickettsiales bacterium]